jgi:hypothetical protein
MELGVSQVLEKAHEVGSASVVGSSNKVVRATKYNTKTLINQSKNIHESQL